MTEKLSKGDCDGAPVICRSLMAGNENPVECSLFWVYRCGGSMPRGWRRKKAGPDFVKEFTGLSYVSFLRRLQAGARRYTLPALAEAVSLCAETDYLMKSSAADDEELLKVLVLRLAFAGGSV
jgi:DNA polymerase III delta subunit